jgi:hydroxymethylglutaryl-CoA lyase
VRVYISTIFGYNGQKTPVRDVVKLARWSFIKGANQVSLGDTTGLGTPESIKELLSNLTPEFSLDQFALHLHTKSEDMKEKVDMAYELGVRTFDSSIGGLGGCPTDKTLGNVDTAELVKHFESNGIITGVNLDSIERITRNLLNKVRL